MDLVGWSNRREIMTNKYEYGQIVQIGSVDFQIRGQHSKPSSDGRVEYRVQKSNGGSFGYAVQYPNGDWSTVIYSSK